MAAMKFTYDHRADAAFIQLVDHIERGEAVRSDACDVGLPLSAILLSFDAADRLLGIEILGASRLLRPEILEAGGSSK
jgi:uncharacterized protein YuzE